MEIFVAAIIVTVMGIHFLDLPSNILHFVIDLGLSFFLSGVFYVLLRGFGLEFLEDYTIGYFSLMTLAVFIVKNAVI